MNLLIIVFLLDMSSTFDVAVQETPPGNKNQASDQAAKEAQYLHLLRTCPNWIFAGAKKDGDGRTILNHLTPLVKLPPDQVKKVINRFLAENPRESDGYLDSVAKVVILNRLYFNIPSDTTVAEIGALNYFNQPLGKPRLVLWPLGVVDGNLKVVGQYEGTAAYPYSFEREFALFRKRFKRRLPGENLR